MVELTRLRSEITELTKGAGTIRQAADDAEHATELEMWDHVTSVIRYLDHSVFPHLAAVDELLFPLLEAELGTPVVGQILGLTHQQIARIADELDETRRDLLVNDPSALHAVRRLLDELLTHLRLELSAVETAVLPALEQVLSEHDADSLQAAMAAASRGLRAPSPSA